MLIGNMGLPCAKHPQCSGRLDPHSSVSQFLHRYRFRGKETEAETGEAISLRSLSGGSET